MNFVHHIPTQATLPARTPPLRVLTTLRATVSGDVPACARDSIMATHFARSSIPVTGRLLDR